MELTDEEREFLTKRTRLVKAWRYVGAGLLLAVIALGCWLFWFSPFLANPFVVLSRLNSDAIPTSIMTLATGLLPLVVLMCLLLTLAIVLFTFASFANERKYLAMIQRMAGMAPPRLSRREAAGGKGSAGNRDSASQ